MKRNGKIDRRVLCTVLSGVVLVAVIGRGLESPAPRAPRPAAEPIRPPGLEPGDTIALVAPAGAVTEEKVREAMRNISRLGYGVKLLRRIDGREGYLAGGDEERAAEINRAFADPEVAMILGIRGGYGSPRLLNLLDYETIRRHPKILVGYSDCTALLIAIGQRTGLVTFHGPMAERDFSGKYGLAPYSTRYFWSLLEAKPREKSLGDRADWGGGAPARLGKRRTVAPGVAEGPLTGGNLSTLVALMGTPYEIETDETILFLEDVNEEPYRIDRMLCQLRLAGKLQLLRGVLLGSFTGCVARNPKGSFTVEEVLSRYFGGLGIPVLAGFPAGHLPDQATLPLGSRVLLDATAKVLTLLEAPVSGAGGSRR